MCLAQNFCQNPTKLCERHCSSSTAQSVAELAWRLFVCLLGRRCLPSVANSAMQGQRTYLVLCRSHVGRETSLQLEVPLCAQSTSESVQGGNTDQAGSFVLFCRLRRPQWTGPVSENTCSMIGKLGHVRLMTRYQWCSPGVQQACMPQAQLCGVESAQQARPNTPAVSQKRSC